MHPISIEFQKTYALNARVQRLGNGYHIDISDAFEPNIYQVMLNIVNLPDVLPWLQKDREERTKGAAILTRLCMEFVVAHEHGHIIGGHVDKLALEENGADGISEFNVVSRYDDVEFDERAHAWEYEADSIGASLLDQPIDDLIALVRNQNLADGERTFLGEAGMAVEHIGALSIAALYVLFRLLRKTKDELKMVGYHPDPLVRAFACRDVIFHRLTQRHECDQKRLKKTLHYHLETFDWALEDLGYSASQMIDDEGVEQVNVALAELAKLQSKYHDQTRDTRHSEWFMSQI